MKRLISFPLFWIYLPLRLLAAGLYLVSVGIDNAANWLHDLTLDLDHP